jgi:ABC-type transport system involved in multi-copper enzyme maturation permease subunit
MITIEFSFAWLFCGLMVLIIFVMMSGIFATPKDTVAIIIIGVEIILLLDLFCVFGSALYMSHPTNGYKFYDNQWNQVCKEYNYTTYSFDDAQPCIMPTPQDNPYEKQPLHPIAWMFEFVWDLGKVVTGAVQFKVM